MIMRILYHHRTQGEEPESVHIAAIVSALRGLGHEVDVMGPSRLRTAAARPRRSFFGRLKQRTPRALVELLQLAYNAVSFCKLAVALGRHRYDFIYERHALYNVAGVTAARAFGVPVILEVNTLYARAWDKYYGLAFGAAARFLERQTLLRAHGIITVTEAQRRLIEAQGIPAERIDVSHNAVDPREFNRERFADSRVRRSLRLAPIVAGFVGTMNRWQGVRGFAETIEIVARARQDVGFLFVGDGEGRAALEADLASRGLQAFAVFLGRQSHAAIPEYLAAMDIGMLLASNDYGSPMKVFEYLAMGAAVIAPAVGPVLEVLRDGETGLLIQPGDAAAMARHILTLAGDPDLRARLARNGREYVLGAHTWDANAEKILEILARRAGARPARSRGLIAGPEGQERGPL
jgi:glycosyltransferase involved in cell wall biosynthesis